MLYTLHFVRLFFKQIKFFKILEFNPDASGTAKSKNQKKKKKKGCYNVLVDYPANIHVVVKHLIVT